MNEAGLITIIVAALGLASSGGVWGYRQFKKEAPIRQRDATIVAADKSVQMAIAVAGAAHDDALAARKDSGDLRLELNTERTERQNLSDRVDELEITVRKQRSIISIWDAAWNDLHSRWPYHRMQDHPPARPNTTEGNTQTT